MTRLEEHKARLEEQLASLRATYEVRTAASAYVAAAPPMAAAAGGLPAAVSGGMLADAAQPSNYLPAPFDGRVASSQPTASVGEGDALAVRTTAVVDYLADAATSAVTAQAAPLAAEQTAPLFATQLSTAAPLTTALATAPSTAAVSERTSAQPSSPDAAAPPQSAVAEVVTTVATTPAVTTPNPCAGKRCPAQYDMVDRGDHCSCRPASAPPQSKDL